MIKVFNSPFKVTQKFGVSPVYYSQFNLDGHEGLDLVPTRGDWSVYSLPYNGQVVKDIDMVSKGGAYGIHTTVWYSEIKEAWMFCHLSSNSVFEGQKLAPGEYIGQMGGTGNTQGAHLHLNRFQVDARGYRLNKDNGFLGGVDPLPFLEQDLTPPAPDPTPTPPAGDVQPMPVVRGDVHEGLLGERIADSTLEWRNQQGLNTRELVKDYMMNDGDVKKRWSQIWELTNLADLSATQHLLEAIKKLKP